MSIAGNKFSLRIDLNINSLDEHDFNSIINRITIKQLGFELIDCTRDSCKPSMLQVIQVLISILNFLIDERILYDWNM